MNKEQRIAKEDTGYKDKVKAAAKKGDRKTVKDLLKKQGIEVVDDKN